MSSEIILLEFVVHIILIIIYFYLKILPNGRYIKYINVLITIN